MTLARGKYAKAISDRSGMEFPYKEMVHEWNGMFVHKSEFEPKHPQIQPKAFSGDFQGLMDTRPARAENEVAQLLPENPFTTYAASSGVINVFSPEHGLTNGTTYRFRGTPSIAGTYTNPGSFDGIAGSNIAKAAGYAITTGKFVSGARVTTNVTDNFFFTVDTSTATVGQQKGGGYPVSVGPVTLTA